MRQRHKERPGKKEGATKRIVVFLEDGLVRDIISDVPLEVLVKDVDEKAEEKVVYTLWTSDEVTSDAQKVNRVFKDFEEERRIEE